MDKEPIWTSNDRKLRKCKQRNGHTNSRSSKNSNKDEAKETYTETQHNLSKITKKESWKQQQKSKSSCTGEFLLGYQPSTQLKSWKFRREWDNIFNALKDKNCQASTSSKPALQKWSDKKVLELRLFQIKQMGGNSSLKKEGSKRGP